MSQINRWAVALAFLACVAGGARAQGQTSPTPQAAAGQQQASPAFEEWADDFGGASLDAEKWERFSFAGGGGNVEVKEGILHLRGGEDSRAGVRSARVFLGERFSVEASLAKVGAALPAPGKKGTPLGFANLTIMFDGSGRNRIEWALTSEGTLEAWSIVDGRGERLDNRKLGTKIPNPVLAIIRRGDEYLFVLNKPDSPPQDAQVALTKTIKNMPRDFRVMLYGFGSSVNNWDAVRVVTAK
jgi:hypothetical protein